MNAPIWLSTLPFMWSHELIWKLMISRYKQGMLQAKVSDPDTVDLIDGAAAGMVATIETQGPDTVQEWEVDELLDWTTSLNFDEYWMAWKETATSANSEKPTGKEDSKNLCVYHLILTTSL